MKEFIVQIVFTTGKREKYDKICYDLPAGRVKSLSVTYVNKLVPREDFGARLIFVGKMKGSELELYEDKENGVGIFSASGYVYTALFGATPTQLQKYASDCRTDKK